MFYVSLCPYILQVACQTFKMRLAGVFEFAKIIPLKKCKNIFCKCKFPNITLRKIFFTKEKIFIVFAKFQPQKKKINATIKKSFAFFAFCCKIQNHAFINTPENIYSDRKKNTHAFDKVENVSVLIIKFLISTFY